MYSMQHAVMNDAMYIYVCLEPVKTVTTVVLFPLKEPMRLVASPGVTFFTFGDVIFIP